MSDSLSDMVTKIKEDVRCALSAQNAKTDTLRKNLAYFRNLRYKDFDLIVENLRVWLCEKEKEVLNALDEFSAAEKEANRKLASFLAEEGVVTSQERYELLEVWNRQSQVRSRLEEILLGFFREQSDIMSALEEIIAYSSVLKARDLLLVIKELVLRAQNNTFIELLRRIRNGLRVDTHVWVFYYFFLVNQRGGQCGACI